jgi:hypothetical protein
VSAEDEQVGVDFAREVQDRGRRRTHTDDRLRARRRRPRRTDEALQLSADGVRIQGGHVGNRGGREGKDRGHDGHDVDHDELGLVPACDDHRAVERLFGEVGEIDRAEDAPQT